MNIKKLGTNVSQYMQKMSYDTKPYFKSFHQDIKSGVANKNYYLGPNLPVNIKKGTFETLKDITIDVCKKVVKKFSK